MTAAGSDEAVAKAFEAQRGRLVAIAYRMLGSRADAEDAMQEAWLRLARQDAAAIDNLPAWLTTVVGRVCIDMLRSRKARPESAFDDPLPGLVVTEDSGEAPEDNVLMADSVGLALLVVLDTLTPAELLDWPAETLLLRLFPEDSVEVLGSRPLRFACSCSRQPGTGTSKDCCGYSIRSSPGAPTRPVALWSGTGPPRRLPRFSRRPART